jgi:hypothetical protein
MDPLTILAAIKTAHSTIKASVEIGRELSSVAGTLSDLMNGVGQLTKIAHQPKGWRTKGSAEAQAIEAYTAKMEALDIEAKVKSMIISEYGLNAWDDIQRNVIFIRKQMKAEAEQEAKDREAMIETLAVIFLVVILIGILGFLLYSVFILRR